MPRATSDIKPLGRSSIVVRLKSALRRRHFMHEHSRNPGHLCKKTERSAIVSSVTGRNCSWSAGFTGLVCTAHMSAYAKLRPGLLITERTNRKKWHAMHGVSVPSGQERTAQAIVSEANARRGENEVQHLRTFLDSANIRCQERGIGYQARSAAGRRGHLTLELTPGGSFLIRLPRRME